MVINAAIYYLLILCRYFYILKDHLQEKVSKLSPIAELRTLSAVPYYYCAFSSFCFLGFIALPSRATHHLKLLSAFFFTHTPVSLGSLLLLTCSLNFIL
jgi:hypothetical protein